MAKIASFGVLCHLWMAPYKVLNNPESTVPLEGLEVEGKWNFLAKTVEDSLEMTKIASPGDFSHLWMALNKVHLSHL